MMKAKKFLNRLTFSENTLMGSIQDPIKRSASLNILILQLACLMRPQWLSYLIHKISQKHLQISPKNSQPKKLILPANACENKEKTPMSHPENKRKSTRRRPLKNQKRTAIRQRTSLFNSRRFIFNRLLMFSDKKSFRPTLGLNKSMASTGSIWRIIRKFTAFHNSRSCFKTFLPLMSSTEAWWLLDAMPYKKKITF